MEKEERQKASVDNIFYNVPHVKTLNIGKVVVENEDRLHVLEEGTFINISPLA